ncbi:MAG: thiamine diphosphokinase [Peptococcaceae bacterium]|nr:thiamine diphosphokinase [Peptococcaceae bacterium]
MNDCSDKERNKINGTNQKKEAELARQKIVVVVTGGDKPDYDDIADKIAAADVLICADSGGDYAYTHHLKPDYLLGDFDSITAEAKQFFIEQGVVLQAVPAEKDFTDTQMALDLAMEFEPDTLYICGGWGSRADHSLANVFLFCRYLSRVSQIVLLGKAFYGYYAPNILEIDGMPGQTVSLIPLMGDVTNLTLTGFYYPVENIVLPWGSSRGISNILVANRGKICHDQGILLVIQHWGPVE